MAELKKRPGSAELCLLPLSKEEQREKGLYTVNPDTASDDPQKGIVFPFKGLRGPLPLPPPVVNYQNFNPFAVIKTRSDQEEQREKGLYTVDAADTASDDPLKGIKFPFKDACVPVHVPKDDNERKPYNPFPLFNNIERTPLTEENHRAFLEQLSRQKPTPPPPQLRVRPGSVCISSKTLAERRDKVRKNSQEILAAEGRCFTGSYLSPFCQCSKDAASSASPLGHHHPDVMPIWLAYHRQIRQSHCFDIDDYPVGASVRPVSPSMNFNDKAKLPMELANRAIHEYNAKECHVFKYEVLKIEKLNFSLQSSSYQYWMTVKVLNLTLATPIETFLVHAGTDFIHFDDRVIYCCRPKEEAIIGLPSCDVCFGKLRGEEEQLDLEAVDEFSERCWNDDNFIPKAASTEHREEFRRIYGRYARQIRQSDGFDLDVYPGDAKEAVYIPYLDFEKETDMLMELANHAIQDFNNGETSAYKYKVSYIEKVNFSMAKCREFFMTVKVINLTLCTPLETFQIHAYKGPHEENVVRLCRKKVLI